MMGEIFFGGWRPVTFGATGPGPAHGTGVPASMGPFELLVIGASFGGPKAIESILCDVPRGLSMPIVVCQHITSGMTKIWAESLAHRCRRRVTEAEKRENLRPGVVYIAPAGVQMRVMRTPSGPQSRLDEDFTDSLHVPSIDVLFSSAAREFGSRTLAVLLTGLGCDGASGMVQIRHAGGYTIGESSLTAASYSMPGAAADAGGVVEQLPLSRIAYRIKELGTA